MKAYVDFSAFHDAMATLPEEQREAYLKELTPKSNYEAIAEEPVEHWHKNNLLQNITNYQYWSIKNQSKKEYSKKNVIQWTFCCCFIEDLDTCVIAVEHSHNLSAVVSCSDKILCWNDNKTMTNT